MLSNKQGDVEAKLCQCRVWVQINSIEQGDMEEKPYWWHELTSLSGFLISYEETLCRKTLCVLIFQLVLSLNWKLRPEKLNKFMKVWHKRHRKLRSEQFPDLLNNPHNFTVLPSHAIWIRSAIQDCRIGRFHNVKHNH